MALTHVGTSAPVFTGVDVAPTVPAGVVEGDHVFLLATAKWISKDFDPATFGGWTLLSNGLVNNLTTGNNVAGQGQIRVGIFYQQVPSGGLTDPVITLTGSGSNTIASGSISAWRSDTGAALNTAIAVGYDTGTVTAFSVTAETDPGLEAGDQVLLFSALTDDGPRWNTFSLAATDATFSALTELADAGSSLGDDTGVGIHIGTVETGTATAPPVFSGTNSAGAGSLGGTHFIRLRETGGGTSIPTATAIGTWAFTGTARGRGMPGAPRFDVTVPIAGPGDDAWVDSWGVFDTAATNGQIHSGISNAFRFVLPIPNGANIESVALTVDISQAENSVIEQVFMREEAIDNAAPPVTGQNIDQRTWGPTAFYGPKLTAPGRQDLKIGNMLRRVLSRPGWQAGNAVMLRIYGQNTTDRGLAASTVRHYDGGAPFPELRVVYGTPAPFDRTVAYAVAESTTTTGTTTLTGLAGGELLLLAARSTSALTGTPAGWNLLGVGKVSLAGNRTAVMWRRATPGDNTVTLATPTANRIVTGLIALGRSADPIWRPDLARSSATTSPGFDGTVQSEKDSDDLFLWTLTPDLWYTSYPWGVPFGATLLPLVAASADTRRAGFYLDPATSGPRNFETNVTLPALGTNEVVLGAVQIPAGPPEAVGSSGAWGFTGAATGKRTPKATADGSFAFTGSTATGKRAPKASTTGSFSFTGTATGSAPTLPGVPTASTTGSWGFTGGTAAGKRTPKGSATGSFAYTGTATGKRTPKATASGSLAFTGTAVGKRTPKATASGAFSFTGAAVGSTPTLPDVPTASATGSWSFTGSTATGKRTAKANATTGTFAYAGSAVGKRTSKATAIGSFAYTGTAVGKRTPKASTSGVWGFTGSAVGKWTPKASATGTWIFTDSISVLGPGAPLTHTPGAATLAGTGVSVAVLAEAGESTAALAPHLGLATLAPHLGLATLAPHLGLATSMTT